MLVFLWNPEFCFTNHRVVRTQEPEPEPNSAGRAKRQRGAPPAAGSVPGHGSTSQTGKLIDHAH